MWYIGWSELYNTVSSLFYTLSYVRLTLFPTPAVVTSMLSLFFSSSLRATARIIAFSQNNISGSLYNNQHAYSEFPILFARGRACCQNMRYKGCPKSNFYNIFQKFQEDCFICSQPAASSENEGLKKLSKLFSVHFMPPKH